MNKQAKYMFTGLMVALLIAMCVSPIMPALAESTYSLLREILSKATDIKAKTDALPGSIWDFAVPVSPVPGSYGEYVKVIKEAVDTEIATLLGRLTENRAGYLDKVPQITVASGSLATLTEEGDLLPAVDIGKAGKVQVTVTILASGTSTESGAVELQISWDGTSYYTLETVTIASGSDIIVTYTFKPFAAQYFKVALTDYPNGATSVAGSYAYVYETAP